MTDRDPIQQAVDALEDDADFWARGDVSDEQIDGLVPMPEPEALGMDFDKGWDGVMAYGHTDAAVAAHTRAAVRAALEVQRKEVERMTAAARDVLAERRRQVESEGWAPERDDGYTKRELAHAAACYAITAGDFTPGVCPPQIWPWPVHWFKPADARRNLVKAGALILAEIERLDRAAMAADKAQGERG